MSVIKEELKNNAQARNYVLISYQKRKTKTEK